MQSIKSYTDLSQSKKLAEILPLESADMSWVSCDDGQQKYYQAENRKIILNYEKNHWFPCWSLAALLNILPQTVRLVGTSKDSYWYCECVNANNQWYAGFESASNPVDATYEMIIKLNELNLL